MRLSQKLSILQKNSLVQYLCVTDSTVYNIRSKFEATGDIATYKETTIKR